MATITTTESAFVKGIYYIPFPPDFPNRPEGRGLALVQLDKHYYIYSVPSWVAGLLTVWVHAGCSLGKFYNEHIKGLQNVKLVDDDPLIPLVKEKANG